MYKWIDGDEKSCVFWLNGWPGTGKSAIARTIARCYHAEGCLAASFFFARGGSDCSHAGLFVTSIARQLADNKALGVQQLIRGSLEEHSQIAKQTL
jgi:MoxR-like ATPase